MKEYLKYEDVIKVLHDHYPKADDMIAAVVCLAAEEVTLQTDSECVIKFGGE